VQATLASDCVCRRVFRRDLCMTVPLYNVLGCVLPEPHVTCCAQNFNVLLSRHNPSTDKHAHFLVQPRQVAKERSMPVPMRKVRSRLELLL